MPAKKRLRVAERCEVSYDAMTPRGAGRHCEDCDRVVVNLSALTERQAISLFRESGGDLCGFVHHDGRGDPLFKPEPRAGIAVGALLAGALAACEPTSEPTSAAAPLETVAPDAANDDAVDAFVMLPMSDSVEAPAATSPTLPVGAPPTHLPLPLAGAASVLADGVASAATDGVASEQSASCDAVTEEPTAEDRALERRKRRRRQLRVRPQPHEAYGGMMMMMD